MKLAIYDVSPPKDYLYRPCYNPIYTKKKVHFFNSPKPIIKTPNLAYVN